MLAFLELRKDSVDPATSSPAPALPVSPWLSVHPAEQGQWPTSQERQQERRHLPTPRPSFLQPNFGWLPCLCLFSAFPLSMSSCCFSLLLRCWGWKGEEGGRAAWIPSTWAGLELLWLRCSHLPGVLRWWLHGPHSVAIMPLKLAAQPPCTSESSQGPALHIQGWFL